MKNTFVSLLILMFVLMFVDRIFGHYKKQHIFPLKLMTNFGKLYFIFIIVLYFNTFLTPFWFWIVCFASILVFPFLIFFTAQFHQHQFYSEFLRFLSVVILGMQRGQSFSSAFEVSLRGNSWKQDQLLKGIFENVVFSQQEPVAKTGQFGLFIQQIHEELTLVQSNQHLAIDRLCNFQKNLRDRIIFRQRSRQIWMYFGYQIGLLSLIYFGLFAFIFIEYGFFQFKKSFFISFLFYSLGILATIYIGKKKKWLI